MNKKHGPNQRVLCLRPSGATYNTTTLGLLQSDPYGCPVQLLTPSTSLAEPNLARDRKITSTSDPTTLGVRQAELPITANASTLAAKPSSCTTVFTPRIVRRSLKIIGDTLNAARCCWASESRLQLSIGRRRKAGKAESKHSKSCEHPCVRCNRVLDASWGLKCLANIRVLHASERLMHLGARNIRVADTCERPDHPSAVGVWSVGGSGRPRYFDVTRRFSCIFAAAFFFMI